MTCQCAETSTLRAMGFPIPPLHSCDYVVKRNVLVHTARSRAARLTRGILNQTDREEAESLVALSLIRLAVANAFRLKEL
ncbi:MAG: hypothetical protein Q8R78_00715 [Candidatus Omnitrophota bacterium]|nr:hypothetical protein [Candidatus Omnitrophota bacterium]